MKRYIFFIAAALLAAVSCSKIYDATPVTQEQTPIGFSTWNETLTKARTITDTDFKNGDKFNVFGSKTLESVPSVVFNGDEVSYDGTNWNYTPPRYWDPLATQYLFYAISPSALLPAGMTDAQKETAATTGAFSTAELTFDGTVAYDVLIADKTPITTFNAPVHLVFNHVASLLDLKVKKSYALKDATVAVTAISIENIINKGTYSVSTYDGSSNKPTVSIANWTPAASSNTNSFDGATGTVSQYGYASTTAEEAVNGSDLFAFQNFVVMPQTLVAAAGTNPQQIKISYTITTTVGEVITHTDKTVAFIAFDNTDNKVNTDPAAAAGWNPNTHYTYTLTLDANKIEFTAEIAEWSSTVVNGYSNFLI